MHCSFVYINFNNIKWLKITLQFLIPDESCAIIHGVKILFFYILYNIVYELTLFNYNLSKMVYKN